MKERASEEITGRYEGEELEERRRGRPPNERIGRLEKKHDDLKDDTHREFGKVRSDLKDLSKQVGDLREDNAGTHGMLAGQEKLLTETLTLVRKSSERDHVTFTAKIDVDKAKALAEVEVDKEHQLDTIDAKKTRRKAIAKGFGLAVGSGGLIEILHRLGVL